MLIAWCAALQRWIFAESVRRTIVLGYSVVGLYWMMGDPEYEGNSAPWCLPRADGGEMWDGGW
jgi:hypothetical protein